MYSVPQTLGKAVASPSRNKPDAWSYQARLVVNDTLNRDSLPRALMPVAPSPPYRSSNVSRLRNFLLQPTSAKNPTIRRASHPTHTTKLCFGLFHRAGLQACQKQPHASQKRWRISPTMSSPTQRGHFLANTSFVFAQRNANPAMFSATQP